MLALRMSQSYYDISKSGVMDLALPNCVRAGLCTSSFQPYGTLLTLVFTRTMACSNFCLAVATSE